MKDRQPHVTPSFPSLISSPGALVFLVMRSWDPAVFFMSPSSLLASINQPGHHGKSSFPNPCGHSHTHWFQMF